MSWEREKLHGWDEDKEALHHMPTTPSYVGNSTTLQLLGRILGNPSYSSSSCRSELIDLDLLELGQGKCLPFGWEKFLDLETGGVYYLNSRAEERPNFKLNGGKVDLELNLSTSKVPNGREKIAEGADSVMRLVGCQRCLMYFMVCGKDAKCPKCNGGILLDFLRRGSISE